MQATPLASEIAPCEHGSHCICPASEMWPGGQGAHALYDSFRSREPLIEARGCSAHWDKVIGRNMSSITSIVVTRAYTKSVMRFAVERISRVSKAELAEISALHREWVKGEDSYECCYVFFLKR